MELQSGANDHVAFCLASTDEKRTLYMWLTIARDAFAHATEPLAEALSIDAAAQAVYLSVSNSNQPGETK